MNYATQRFLAKPKVVCKWQIPATVSWNDEPYVLEFPNETDFLYLAKSMPSGLINEIKRQLSALERDVKIFFYFQKATAWVSIEHIPPNSLPNEVKVRDEHRPAVVLDGFTKEEGDKLDEEFFKKYFFWTDSYKTELEDLISIDEERCGGRPCIYGTRITVEYILQQLLAENDESEVKENLELSDSPYDIALLYWYQSTSNPNQK